MRIPQVFVQAPLVVKRWLIGQTRRGSSHSVAACLGSAHSLLDVLDQLGGECAGEFGQ